MSRMDMAEFRLVSWWSMKAEGKRTNHQVWPHISNLNTTSTTKNGVSRGVCRSTPKHDTISPTYPVPTGVMIVSKSELMMR